MNPNFNYYASGTKCEFEWEVEVSDEGIPEGQAVYLDWAYCKIDIEQLPDATFGDDLWLRQGVRFASNHFTEGVKNVVVYAHVTVWNTVTGSIISEREFQSQPWQLEVYNRVGFIANRMQNGGGEPNPDYYDPAMPGGPTIPYSAKRIAKRGIENTFAPGFGSTNYHVYQGNVEIARAMEEPQVRAEITNGTAFVYATHGEYYNFNDSYSYSESGYGVMGFGNITALTLGNYVDEITPAIYGKTAWNPPLPSVNLVMMWACQVLRLPFDPNGVNTFLANRFGITSTSDRAFAGFQNTVLGGLKAGIEWHDQAVATEELKVPLHTHADIVLDHLKSGSTLGEAIMSANQQRMPRWTPDMFGDALPHPMKIVGDADYRLVKVYAASFEQADFPNWRQSWYLIFY